MGEAEPHADSNPTLQVEELILGKLEDCAREGFSPTAIEAAINTIEFSLRENNTGSFPRGLSLMLRASAAWIYNRDPFRPLQWTEDLERFKVRSEPAIIVGGFDVIYVWHAVQIKLQLHKRSISKHLRREGRIHSTLPKLL